LEVTTTPIGETLFDVSILALLFLLVQRLHYKKASIESQKDACNVHTCINELLRGQALLLQLFGRILGLGVSSRCADTIQTFVDSEFTLLEFRQLWREELEVLTKFKVRSVALLNWVTKVLTSRSAWEP